MNSAGLIDNNTIAARFSEAISHYTDKQLARMSGACPRTFKNHRQGLNAPSAAIIINLMRNNDDVFHAMLDLAQRQPASSEAIHQRIQKAMNILGGSHEIHPDRIPPMEQTKEDNG